MDEQNQGNQIRLLLVDDQALFRASLSRYLATQPGLEVAGEGSTATQSLEILNGSCVDIVLFNLGPRAEWGDELISPALAAWFKGHFLIFARAAVSRALAGRK